MSKTETEKNIVQFNSSVKKEIINRIVKENGCPLCSMVMDFEFDFLAKLQHKVANEENIRREISSEGGFCDFHFRQFKKIASGKTNILLLNTIIEEKIYSKDFSDKKDNYRIECRICNSVNEYEKECVKNFTDILQQEENRNKYKATNGICSVHLKQADKIIADENIKLWLNNTYKTQIERMQGDFEEMSSHKSFYEIDREKRKLINVLIEKLAGRKTRGL
jgi:hypothetical protein